jgi:hypothetical protein
VIIFLAIALAGAFITQNTTLGRYLYAIGGNPDAARLSGINIRKYLLVVFCMMGVLTGVASLIYTARVGSASPDAGQLLELDAIAACVIGGTSLMGGRGTVFGAILGALIMASLDNGMSLKNVEPYMQISSRRDPSGCCWIGYGRSQTGMSNSVTLLSDAFSASSAVWFLAQTFVTPLPVRTSDRLNYRTGAKRPISTCIERTVN